MDVRKSLCLLTMALFSIVAFYGSPTEACSCMPSHPQTHFCEADYVILIRVKKQANLEKNKISYKVQVRRSYKMNEKAEKMLKHGLISTAKSEANCGVKLENGKLYMIAGRAPFLNTCSYVKEYQKMSLIERRGFIGIYRKGCKCEIRPCFGSQCLRQRESKDSCKWSPFSKCETDYSACMVHTYSTPEGNISKCHWRRTSAYLSCMRDP